MSIPGYRLSDEVTPAPYLSPDGIPHTPLSDWEKGPKAVADTTEGMAFQDWFIDFKAGEFTITPSDEGLPVVIVTGSEPLDCIQCTFCFDQNAQPAIAWVDSTGAGKLYWFNIDTGQPEIITFEDPVASVALCLDDKRPRQVQVNDILLWYTVPSVNPGEHILYHLLQRDRFDTPYEMINPAPYPYLRKSGMHEELRVQISLSNVRYG